MKVAMIIGTHPSSFDLEDDMENNLTGSGLLGDLEAAIESWFETILKDPDLRKSLERVAETEILEIMEWRNIRVQVSLEI